MITGSSDFRILQAMLDRDFCNCRRAIKIDGIVEGPHHLILRLLPNHLTIPCMCGLVCVRQRLTYCTIHLVGCGTHSHIIFKWLRIDNPPAVLRFSPVVIDFPPAVIGFHPTMISTRWLISTPGFMELLLLNPFPLRLWPNCNIK